MSGLRVTVTGLVRDEGTVLVFAGTDENGEARGFVADHRAGWRIVDALDAGEEVVADVPGWALVSSPDIFEHEDGGGS